MKKDWLKPYHCKALVRLMAVTNLLFKSATISYYVAGEAATS